MVTGREAGKCGGGGGGCVCVTVYATEFVYVCKARHFIDFGQDHPVNPMMSASCLGI